MVLSAPAMPIWDGVRCGRRTVIEVLRPSVSEKKSKWIRAMKVDGSGIPAWPPSGPAGRVLALIVAP
ncbi:hypothetical protein GCM10011608_05940 [Micromonospora sonchi]|uniref:Uncharacterized protein n=1 Tax=Micromonospora sonchi TaxID=1763543 RepID=A0A917WQV2_9ACTN|nr:hypothetical protein GCM10011608_05940 [Micromonospora sonchi]